MWVRPFGADPLGQRLGQAVVQPLLDVRVLDRIDGADQVIERHARLRPRVDVLRDPLALELGAEIVREIVRHELAAVGLIAADAVQLAEGVVQRRVERAGRRQRATASGSARPAHACGRARAPRRGTGLSSVHIRSMGCPYGLVRRGDVADAAGERLHGVQRLIVGQRARRPRPHVAHRHRAEAARALAVLRRDHAVDVQDGDAIGQRAAELQRRAIAMLLVGERDVVDLDVGRLAGGDALHRRRLTEVEPGHALRERRRGRRRAARPRPQRPPPISRGKRGGSSLPAGHCAGLGAPPAN